MKGPVSITESIGRMPFLRLLPPLIVGVVAAEYVSLSAPVLLALAAAAFVCLFVFRGRTAQRAIIVALTLVIGAASVKVLCPEEDIPRGVKVALDCKVTDNVTTRGRWHRTTAKVFAFRPVRDTSRTWRKSAEHILLYIDTAYAISPGDRVGFTAYVNPLDTLGGTSGYARTMRSRGFLGQAFVREGDMASVSPDTRHSLWEHIMLKSKAAQRTLTERIVSGGGKAKESGVAMALLTGDRRLLDPETRDEYSRAGVSHILAISGLHLGIIFLFLNFFLSLFAFMRRGQWVKMVLIILLLWTYAFVTGLSASVLRSAFMLTVMQVSMMGTGRYNSYNALFSSAFVLILVNPWYVYDISFQMSYLAIFTILFFFPRLRRWTGAARAERWLRGRERRAKKGARLPLTVCRNMFMFATGSILVAVAAQIGVAPITGYFFGRFPLLNVLINPLVMVVLMQIMLSGFVYLALSGTPPGEFIGRLFNTLLETQNGIVKWTSSFPHASVDYELSLGWLYVSYGLIIALMIVIKWVEDARQNKRLF